MNKEARGEGGREMGERQVGGAAEYNIYGWCSPYMGAVRGAPKQLKQQHQRSQITITIKKFKILQELPKGDRHKVSKCCWGNDTSRPDHRVATNFRFVYKKEKIQYLQSTVKWSAIKGSMPVADTRYDMDEPWNGRLSERSQSQITWFHSYKTFRIGRPAGT